MTDDGALARQIREILDAITVIENRMRRVLDLVEKIALGMGINPNG